MSQYISQDRNNIGTHVACSKCNEVFESNRDCGTHYNERHAL